MRRHHHCAVVVLLLERLAHALGAALGRLLPCGARVIHPQRHVLHAVAVPLDVRGNLALRAQRRGQHQPHFALLQHVGGAVALSRLRAGIGNQLMAEGEPVVVGRLPRIAYIKLDIIRAVQRQEVLLGLSLGMHHGRHCLSSTRGTHGCRLTAHRTTHHDIPAPKPLARWRRRAFLLRKRHAEWTSTLHCFPKMLLRRSRWAEPGGERVSEPHLGQVSHPGHISVGPNQDGCRSSDHSDRRKLPRTSVLGVNQRHAIRPWSDVKAGRLTEVDQHRPGLVQQREEPQRAIGGDQVEVGHAASEQRVSLAQVVMNVQT